MSDDESNRQDINSDDESEKTVVKKPKKVTKRKKPEESTPKKGKKGVVSKPVKKKSKELHLDDEVVKKPKKEIETKKSKELKSKRKKKEEEKEDEKHNKYYDTGDTKNYSLYATTVCGAQIKKIIEIFTPLTPDAIIKFTDTGLSILGMEQVKLAILSAHFEKRLFHPFKCDKNVEIGIDTQHFSRLLQHVPKYDSITFITPDSEEMHTLGMMTINNKKNTYNYTKVVGNETSDMDDAQMPPQKFEGFLEFAAADFQHHIHELLQTASVVTFATNFKDFKMITKGTATSGPFSPRVLSFNPSEDGIKFHLDHSPFEIARKMREEDEESPFAVPQTDQDADEISEIESELREVKASLKSARSELSKFLEEKESIDHELQEIVANEEAEFEKTEEEQELENRLEGVSEKANEKMREKLDLERSRDKLEKRLKTLVVKNEIGSESVQVGFEKEDQDAENGTEENETDPKPKRRNRTISDMIEEAETKLGPDYVEATYMLKYINSFTKTTQLAEKVLILFQHQGPLILHYPMEGGVITFCLSDITAAADQSRT